MKNVILLLVFAVVFSGCATMFENMPGMTHTAALMVNQDVNSIVAQLQQVGLTPDSKIVMKDVYDEKARGIAGYDGDFSATHRFVILFDNGKFIRFLLQTKGAPNLDMGKDDPMLKGYFLSRNGSTIKVSELR